MRDFGSGVATVLVLALRELVFATKNAHLAHFAVSLTPRGTSPNWTKTIYQWSGRNQRPEWSNSTTVWQRSMVLRAVRTLRPGFRLLDKDTLRELPINAIPFRERRLSRHWPIPWIWYKGPQSRICGNRLWRGGCSLAHSEAPSARWTSLWLHGGKGQWPLYRCLCRRWMSCQGRSRVCTRQCCWKAPARWFPRPGRR